MSGFQSAMVSIDQSPSIFIASSTEQKRIERAALLRLLGTL